MSEEKKIVWEDPGPKQGSHSTYQWFYDGLKENPGKWARYPGAVTSARSYCGTHREFEWTTRAGDDGKQHPYMRYVRGTDEVD